MDPSISPDLRHSLSWINCLFFFERLCKCFHLYCHVNNGNASSPFVLLISFGTFAEGDYCEDRLHSYSLFLTPHALWLANSWFPDISRRQKETDMRPETSHPQRTNNIQALSASLSRPDFESIYSLKK